MVIDLDNYHKLKKRIDGANREKERATGVMSQLIERLRKEFGINDKESGLKLLDKMKQKMSKEEKALIAAIEISEKKFRQSWPADGD